MVKTITEICVKIDKYKNDMGALRDIWDYLQLNQPHYAESEWDYMAEHLKETVRDLKGRMYVKKLKED